MKNVSKSGQTDTARRQLLIATGAVVGMAVVGLPRLARAADLPHLTADDPTAQALGYSEDSSKIDSAKYANHTPDMACANCNFYQGAGAEFGPCQLYPGKAVNAKGWCAGYAKKA